MILFSVSETIEFSRSPSIVCQIWVQQDSYVHGVGSLVLLFIFHFISSMHTVLLARKDSGLVYIFSHVSAIEQTMDSDIFVVVNA